MGRGKDFTKYVIYWKFLDFSGALPDWTGNWRDTSSLWTEHFSWIWFFCLAFTLHCGSCHGVDEKECERTQKMKGCGDFGTCMTISYIMSEGNASVVYPIYKKGCSWNMKNCLRHCLQLERFLHVHDCQVRVIHFLIMWSFLNLTNKC